MLMLLAALGCHQDDDDDLGCDTDAQTGCDAGLVCEDVVGDAPACFAPLWVEGRVFDTSDDAGIGGALVVARDINGAAVSPVAPTADDGTFSLRLPSPREPDGTPAGDPITLRADAAGYLTFPAAPRSALPVDPTDATGDPLVVANAATDIGLIALDADGTGTISGRVDADLPGGTLVVAGSATGIADVDGAFTVFNVVAGTVEVAGYKTGLQLDRATVDVSDGETTAGVVLGSLGSATARVSGSVQIVNAPGGASTSVLLIVEDTFDATTIRGEAPPGLRAGNVDGSWSISGVPDGAYVVLAAFESDDLVRDPDTSIGGTDIVHLTVSGSDATVEGFKVTEALEVLYPGADGVDTVSGPLTLSWVDDSSEDLYVVEVYDALGELVWETSGDFDPGGSAPVEVPYEGPLQPGMVYQFRATSLKSGVPLSTTEDLDGVFQVPLDP